MSGKLLKPGSVAFYICRAFNAAQPGVLPKPTTKINPLCLLRGLEELLGQKSLTRRSGHLSTSLLVILKPYWEESRPVCRVRPNTNLKLPLLFYAVGLY